MTQEQFDKIIHEMLAEIRELKAENARLREAAASPTFIVPPGIGEEEE